jgi:hypothetical protein
MQQLDFGLRLWRWLNFFLFLVDLHPILNTFLVPVSTLLTNFLSEF